MIFISEKKRKKKIWRCRYEEINSIRRINAYSVIDFGRGLFCNFKTRCLSSISSKIFLAGANGFSVLSHQSISIRFFCVIVSQRGSYRFVTSFKELLLLNARIYVTGGVRCFWNVIQNSRLSKLFYKKKLTFLIII